jgi:hypothetical protein
MSTQITKSTSMPAASANSLPASMHLASMTACVAATSHSPADYVEWRDVFCQDCDMNECMKGTAEELAKHVLALDWMVTDVKKFNVRCASCGEIYS